MEENLTMVLCTLLLINHSLILLDHGSILVKESKMYFSLPFFIIQSVMSIQMLLTLSPSTWEIQLMATRK